MRVGSWRAGKRGFADAAAAERLARAMRAEAGGWCTQQSNGRAKGRSGGRSDAVRTFRAKSLSTISAAY